MEIEIHLKLQNQKKRILQPEIKNGRKKYKRKPIKIL